MRPRMFERRRPLLALRAVRVEGGVARRFRQSIRGRREIMLRGRGEGGEWVVMKAFVAARARILEAR